MYITTPELCVCLTNPQLGHHNHMYTPAPQHATPILKGNKSQDVTQTNTHRHTLYKLSLEKENTIISAMHTKRTNKNNNQVSPVQLRGHCIQQQQQQDRQLNKQVISEYLTKYKINNTAQRN